jgi:hypothetical protein
MPYPYTSGAKTPGTSLGVHIGLGGNEPGLFSRVSPQVILEDARQYKLSGHAAHTDVAGHNFTDTNEYGMVTSYPTIVPFNGGWFSLQQIDMRNEDAHWSGIIETFWRGTAIDLNGAILWQKDYTAAELGTPQYQAPSVQFPNGVYREVVAIAGNNASQVLILTRDNVANTSTFKRLTFDGSGNFTATTSFTDVFFTAYSYHYTMCNQFLTGSGMIAFSNRDLTNGNKIMCLRGDLTLVGSLTLGATIWNRQIVQGWQGDPRPHVIDTTGSNTWTATPIIFDGVSAPSFGTPYSGDALQEIVFATPHTDGFLGVRNWDVGDVYPKPADYWIAADGAPATVAPNGDSLEWVYNNGWTTGDVSKVCFDPAVVTDNYGRHAVDSPYNNDNWNHLNFVVRVNVGEIEAGKAGFVDLLPQYPEAPTQAFTGYTGYGSVALDEAGYFVPNGYNDRILMWSYHYWKQRYESPYTQQGWEYGQHRLTSYWVFRAGDDPTPPTVPGWVDVFGSTAPGTQQSGNGPCIDCGMLGSGNNRAFLYDRGGARKIAEITDITTLRWNRVRDDISDATVIVNAPTPQCCAILANIAVGRHEIVIFRDQDRVWEGPITRVNWKASSVEIVAADICHYLSRTIMHNAYDNRWAKTGSKVGPVTHRAQAILANELKRKEALSSPVNILRFLDVRTDANTTKTSRFTYPYQSTVWEEIDYMAQRLSLDYTVVGRRLCLFDTHAVLSRLQMLTDKDFTDELIVSSYGMELATISAVTDGEGHWASVGGIDDFYGEVELLNTTYGEGVKPENPTAPTKEELAALAREMTSQAQRNMSGRYPIPTVVRIPDGTQLQPSAPVCITELVPGVRIPIRSTLACLTLEQEQKLDKVAVEQTQDGETVSITLSPAPGTTPWDDSSDSAPGDDGLEENV